MQKQKYYNVNIASVMHAAKADEIGVIARKIIACAMDMSRTEELADLNLFEDYKAIDALKTLMGSVSSIIVPYGKEPIDPFDVHDNNSLEVLCTKINKENKEMSQSLLLEMQQNMADGNLTMACKIAINAMAIATGSTLRKIVKNLEGMSQGSSFARILHAEFLIKNNLERNHLDEVEKSLLECTGDDDAEIAGYAHYLLGTILLEEEARSYEVMRHFESAAYLGFSEASELAGEVARITGKYERASKNFKYGINNKNYRSMVKYALLVIKGVIPYDPDWRSYLVTAAENNDEEAIVLMGIMRSNPDALLGDDKTSRVLMWNMFLQAENLSEELNSYKGH